MNREESQSRVQSFITQNSISYPILMDTDGYVYMQYKGSNFSKFAPFPRDVIIDKEGKILYYSKAYHPKAMINVITDYLNITSLSDTRTDVISSFTLYRNYPNPFNPVTTIDYQIKKTTYVELFIYTPLGKKIKTLVNTYRNSGNYSVTWDGTNDEGIKLSSGVYICQLKAGNFVQTKEILLLK